LKHFALAAILTLSAASLFAAGLSQKNKDWSTSPQSYFMTAEERADWAKVRTDEEAEQFQAAFLARRPATFADEVAQSAAAADKYFTVANTHTPGSKTARGKLVILLGPPAGITLAKKKVRADLRSSPNMVAAGGGEGKGGGQGPSVSDMMAAADSAGGGSGVVNEYTITYPADKLPAGYGKALTVKIDVNNDGTDTLAERSQERELERIYELSAKAHLSAPH
jgi:GWxTD domain-containing protein